MMAGEVGLALMLVVGAGLLASSLVRLYRSGAGFDPRRAWRTSRCGWTSQPLQGEALMRVLPAIWKTVYAASRG